MTNKCQIYQTREWLDATFREVLREPTLDFSFTSDSTWLSIPAITLSTPLLFSSSFDKYCPRQLRHSVLWLSSFSNSAVRTHMDRQLLSYRCMSISYWQ